MALPTRDASPDRLKQAVHRARATSTEGLLERLFTFAFKHLVYPQIWEDPEVDMAALLRPFGLALTAGTADGGGRRWTVSEAADATAEQRRLREGWLAGR